MRAQEFVAEGRGTGYKEIEFVCANPEFPDATDPELQKQMYLGLKQIPGVVPLFQDQSDYSEGQYSLTVIYKDRAVRSQILKLAKQLGVQIDLEQPVSDKYVDRAIRGEHEGQKLDELSFLGSECTKDCSGHRAGYDWSKRKGLRQANSWSPSFFKGAGLAVAGK